MSGAKRVEVESGRRQLLTGMLMACVAPAWAQSSAERTLRVGSSMPLTGPLAAPARLLVSGAKLYFERTNQAGGINGAHVEFLVLDDAFEPAKAAENCRVLIEKRDVLSLFGNPGTAQVLAALPEVHKTGTPLFGPVSGAPQLRRERLPELFHVRASFRDELQRIIDHAKTVGVTRIGLFHTDDALGQSVLEELRGLVRASDMQVAGVAGVSFRGGNITAAAKDLWSLQPQAIVVGAAGANFGQFLAAYKHLGGTAPQMYGLSVVDPAGLESEVGDTARGVVLAQIMPSTRNTIIPVVREYREALAKARPGAEPAVLELDAFVSAKILVEGLRRAGRHPTKSGLISALEGLGRYDAGGYVVTYSRENHNGSTFVDLAIVGANGKLQY
jgi:ABC-type branched-subunit amino acid transport system substrate-binding protein